MMNIEKETIINFNEDEATANVYTYNARLKRRLQDLSQQYPNEVVENHSGNYTDYEVPKGRIRINPPRRAAVLTEQQKQDRVAALRRGRGNKQNNEYADTED